MLINISSTKYIILKMELNIIGLLIIPSGFHLIRPYHHKQLYLAQYSIPIAKPKVLIRINSFWTAVKIVDIKSYE